MEKQIYEGPEPERALLIGVDTGEERDFDRSMEELGHLVKACGMAVAGVMTQRLAEVSKTFYMGSGKVEELKEFAVECRAQILIFDNSLTPSQIRNLDRELELPILDRTALILEIFSQRAGSREARLQVETARLQYLLPRLKGLGKALSRQGGAGGSMSSKGSGEKKLELDRRKIERRISELGRELAAIEKERSVRRKRRMSSRIPKVALVGYTNAGKSTILNRLVERFGSRGDKTVPAEDMLFATLDTSVRSIDTGDRKPFFLTDTVGFIHKLPHGLVKAFRSTLEEVKYADLLVQVVDYSDEEYLHQMEVTAETLKELGAGDIPMIFVYNKSDRPARDKEAPILPSVRGDRIYTSAVNGIGMEELAAMIQDKTYGDHEECTFFIPYTDGSAVSYLCENGIIRERDYREDGVLLRGKCHRGDRGKYDKYLVKETKISKGAIIR